MAMLSHPSNPRDRTGSGFCSLFPRCRLFPASLVRDPLKACLAINFFVKQDRLPVLPSNLLVEMSTGRCEQASLIQYLI